METDWEKKKKKTVPPYDKVLIFTSDVKIFVREEDSDIFSD